LWEFECKEPGLTFRLITQDSHLRFYCLYCDLLSNDFIAIQKGKKAPHSKRRNMNRTDLEKECRNMLDYENLSAILHVKAMN